MKRIILIIFSNLMLLSTNLTFAECVWQWDCSSYPCKQVPICENSLDLVPIKPISIAPIPSPSIQPIDFPSIPPIGTTQCEQKYICNAYGCNWQKICE